MDKINVEGSRDILCSGSKQQRDAILTVQLLANESRSKNGRCKETKCESCLRDEVFPYYHQMRTCLQTTDKVEVLE